MASFKSVAELDAYLLTRSYVTGYTFSADDAAVYASLAATPCKNGFPNAHRWATHIAALTNHRFFLRFI